MIRNGARSTIASPFALLQTNVEYRARVSSLSPAIALKANSTYYAFSWEIPDHVDWRTRNEWSIVTPVRDQGPCRASWAFAAVAALEGQRALFAGSLLELSEQQLIDCSADFSNDACRHGSVVQAFKYIESAGGIDAAYSYPYRATGMICQFDRQNVSARVMGVVSVENDEQVLKDAVANVGPVAVSLDVASVYFQFYARGILNGVSCSSEANHALTVIGYGAEEGQEFWLLKNSWGTGWGEDGYLRLARNTDNLCGIASRACYPLLQTF